jgi:hypothetical protein
MIRHAITQAIQMRQVIVFGLALMACIHGTERACRTPETKVAETLLTALLACIHGTERACQTPAKRTMVRHW